MYTSLLQRQACSLSGGLPLWIRLQPICTTVEVTEIMRVPLHKGRGLLKITETEARILLPQMDLKTADQHRSTRTLGRYTPTERFVIAHELGHLILLRNGAPKPIGASEYWKLEEVCNDFARRLLINEEALNERLEGWDNSALSLLNICSGLASAAKVPWSVAAYRISDYKPDTGFLRLEPAEYGFKIVVSTFPNEHHTGWLGSGKKVRQKDPLYEALFEIKGILGSQGQIPTNAFSYILDLNLNSDCAVYHDQYGIKVAIVKAMSQ